MPQPTMPNRTTIRKPARLEFGVEKDGKVVGTVNLLAPLAAASEANGAAPQER